DWIGGRGPFQWSRLPLYTDGLRRVLREVQPDLVHAGPVQPVAFIAAWVEARPLVVMSWGSDILRAPSRSVFTRAITRFVLRRADVFLADNRVVARKARELGLPRSTPLAVFPWGVDLEQFSPDPALGERLRSLLGWQDAFIVLHTRSWEPIYGVDVVARAFVQAARREPRLRLFMLGRGSQEAQIREILEQGGVLERVHFAGQVSQDDLPNIYRAADLYVSASYSDGSSVSLMEALASGVPVLVSDIPSNREWVTPGREGELFPPGDAEALAAAILRFARQSRRALQAMRRNARLRAEAQADWSRNVQRLWEAYRWALSLAPRPRPARS
ncbi:MAG: glycosyltransferase family 4 protein, partial [Chloroflexi bacterium]|nr:glycosyltransferase family 4 protein [Chloroflexota bacterium]